MSNRKDEHVALAMKYHESNKHSDFDEMKFIYQSLPQFNVDDVILKTSFNEIEMDYPFYINAMTGGSEKTKEINKKLAYVASQTGIAIASGSLSAALKDDALKESFKVLRDHNKDGLVFANMGAEYTSQDGLNAIDILEADVLQIHINVLQELVMPEGDRTFISWIDNIKECVETIDKPIIVKEVGFGMSARTIDTLIKAGVKIIDVSGSGGTNFVKIENARRKEKEYDYLEEFGISTLKSLMEAKPFMDEVDILASGGVRNPLDIVKCLALGAKAVGVSGLILNSVMNDGEEKTIQLINRWKEEIKVIMTLIDCQTIPELTEVEYVLSTSMNNWKNQRN